MLKETNNKFELFLTKRESSILVIDGQHRLEGLKEAGDVKYNVEIAFVIVCQQIKNITWK